MKKWRVLLTVVTGAMIGAAWLTLSASAEDKKGPERVARVKDIMAGIHRVHCGAIGKALKGDLDEKGWEKIIVHAAMMNESGHILMQNNRCPDGVWAKAAGVLREGAAGVVAAAKSQDKDAASAAFKKMTSSCKSCHKAHRKRAHKKR